MFILEKKMSKAEKQKLKNGGSYTVFRGKSNGHINANLLFPSHTYSGKHVTSKPHVKHVTNVKQDVHVKLSRVATDKPQLPPHLQHQHHHKHQHQQQNHRHNMYLPGYRVKSAPYPPVDYNANSTKLREGTNGDVITNGNHVTTTSARHSSHSPINSVSNGVSHYRQEKHINVDQNKSEMDRDTSFKSDNDSLTEQQDQVISTLDDTLKSFTMDDSDSDDKEVPRIVADVLPYGVYESFNINDVNMDSSETTGTSRTSSFSNESSINSRTSIIARRRENDEGSRKTSNSVKFKLPEGHVDKPYSPMQVKSKQQPNNREHVNHGYREMGPPSFTAICFSDEKGKFWHTGNGVVVQENPPKRRSGPFKGSFRGLFYGKYAEKDALINTDTYKSKAPQFLNTIDSFESLSLEGEKIESKGSLTRRNTFHFK